LAVDDTVVQEKLITDYRLLITFKNMQTAQAILALGSNIEPRTSYIEGALHALRQLSGIYNLRASSLHETEPVDVPEGDQHQLFLNAVAVCETSLSAAELSEAVHRIEDALGRKRSAQYGSARTIDIDIIALGELTLATPALTLPHPRAHQRAFVLAPLAELLPDYRLPSQQQTVAELLKTLSCL
jgi:2-amino-4-hydroxy-6-hydroxymethyldihydropteridine diphosphokinase